MLLTGSRNFTPPLLLVLRAFQYSLAGNHLNRIHKCSCDHPWVSTVLRGLTISLQEEAKDIVQAVSEIKTLTLTLKQVRENVDSYHTMKQSLKCVVWLGLHHQCAGYVVVSITEQTCQHPIFLSTTEESSQFQFWTILLSSTGGLAHIRKLLSKVSTWCNQSW